MSQDKNVLSLVLTNSVGHEFISVTLVLLGYVKSQLMHLILINHDILL